jgi:hypothetical protein
MEIEFLKEGSADCPLVRIFGIDPQEFSTLADAIKELARAEGIERAADQLPGFHGVSNCRLTIISISTDDGVRQVSETTFVWALSPSKWLLVGGLIEPFAARQCDGLHQWLTGPQARYGLNRGPISILLSCSDDGRW